MSLFCTFTKHRLTIKLKNSQNMDYTVYSSGDDTFKEKARRDKGSHSPTAFVMDMVGRKD